MKGPPIGFHCGASSHNVSFSQYGGLLVAFAVLLLTNLSLVNMSAVLLAKQSVGRLPSCVVRPGVACCYHTKKGVYGYRPKRSDSPQQFPTVPYQGQCWFNGSAKHHLRLTNVAKKSAFITFDFMLFSVLVMHLWGDCGGCCCYTTKLEKSISENGCR